MTRSFPSRRSALVGVVVVLGLSACGDPDAQTGSSIPAPGVIEVAGPGGDVEASAADAAMPSKMMPMNLVYVYEGEIVDLTSPAASWYFAPGTVPNNDQVLAVAAALGVEGDVRELGADLGGGWMVGPADYSQPSLTVGTDAALSWWYSPATIAESRAAEPCELYPPGDPQRGADGAALPECVEPQPPAGVPTATEAEAKATALFTALGFNVGDYRLETYADEWGANVNAYLLVEGMETDMTLSVGYGAEGAITWAGGFLAEPQRGPDYPRIGIEAAVERLNTQGAQGGWFRYGAGTSVTSVISTGGVAVEQTVVAPQAPAEGDGAMVAVTDVAQAPFEPVDTVPAAAVPVDTVLIDPMPVEPPLDCTDPAVSCLPVEEVPQAPITVTLTTASPSLEQLWAADGTVWLLPGYDFTATDGGRYSVIVIEDEYLQVVEPDVLPIEPLPAETVLVEPGTVDTTTVVTGGADPGTGGEPTPDTAPVVTVSLADAAAVLVGLSEDEATKVAETNGWTMRVVRRDGEDLPVTMDLRPNRYNVAVEAGLVTEVVSGG